MRNLHVSQFRRHRTSEDVGHVATFSLKQPCTGLVCQYVVHTVRFDGQRRAKVRKFTEAWTVRDGKVSLVLVAVIIFCCLRRSALALAAVAFVRLRGSYRATLRRC